MRVMVLVKATDDSEKGILPTTEMFEAMGKYNDELVKAGIMRAADGLKPSSQGKRIAIRWSPPYGHRRAFPETRDLVAGFWLWEVKDMDEAVAWVKRCPNPMPGPSEIEIRPLYEMADLRRNQTSTG
jgi:hypothetical protein